MRQSRTVSVFWWHASVFCWDIKNVFQNSFIAPFLFFFSWMCFYELKTMILHLQWDLSVFRSTQQQHGRGLTWCIGYLRTSFYPVHLLPLCLRDRERESDWARGQANLPKWHSVNCFVCPFFLPGCGLQERLKSQMHGHFVWGGWQKRKTKFTNLKKTWLR